MVNILLQPIYIFISTIVLFLSLSLTFSLHTISRIPPIVEQISHFLKYSTLSDLPAMMEMGKLNNKGTVASKSNSKHSWTEDSTIFHVVGFWMMTDPCLIISHFTSSSLPSPPSTSSLLLSFFSFLSFVCVIFVSFLKEWYGSS